MAPLSRSAFLAVALATGLATLAHAQAVVYQQPHNGTGQVMKSAWYPPDGLDGDEYVYDSFVVGASDAITAITWRGGYTNFLSGAGESPVFDFTITILPSIGGGSQPDILAAPLAQYAVGGNAGETPAGTFGGVPLYDYSFTLPSAFMAAAGTTYWLQVEASQGLTPFPYYWPPDWGLAVGTGGNGSHFRAITGGTAGGGTLYQTVTNDAAFALLSATATTYTIADSVTPPGAGTVTGAGPYPVGTIATLHAAPNPGFGFVEWTEGGVQVSTSPDYAFTVTNDRTLVAVFTTAYTVTTAAAPLYGGTTTGDGVYNLGSTVTVTATPDTGFMFTHWTELGTDVSVSASYAFTAGADRALVANFTPLTLSALYDFDTGYPTLGTGAGLPFSQLVNGVTAYFSSPQGNAFSVQTDGSTGWRMAYFAAHYLSDNNLNRNALDILFSHQLSGIYLTFATADFNQAEVPTTLLLTAYENSPASPPVGTATAHGAYIGSTMPMGTLSFNSAAPFDMVELILPYQPLGCTDFFVDNILVALQHPAAVPPGPPAATLLLAPAPNPSRGTTRITFDLAEAGAVRLAVFDLSGRRVIQLADGEFQSGRHTLTWDGRDAGGAQAAAGAYFVRFEGGGRTQARKLALMR